MYSIFNDKLNFYKNKYTIQKKNKTNKNTF